MHTLYRSVGSGKLSEVSIKYCSGIGFCSEIVRVDITLSRPCRFQAGQYIYLCIPGLSPGAILQSHLFVVTWWCKDAKQNDVATLLIEPRKGFTRALSQPTRHAKKAIIEGPYGDGPDLGRFGTVLLFASGNGIAAQLPFVEQLMEGYQNRCIKTKRISLYWELVVESKP